MNLTDPEGRLDNVWAELTEVGFEDAGVLNEDGGSRGNQCLQSVEKDESNYCHRVAGEMMSLQMDY